MWRSADKLCAPIGLSRPALRVLEVQPGSCGRPKRLKDGLLLFLKNKKQSVECRALIARRLCCGGGGVTAL